MCEQVFFSCQNTFQKYVNHEYKKGFLKLFNVLIYLFIRRDLFLC